MRERIGVRGVADADKPKQGLHAMLPKISPHD